MWPGISFGILKTIFILQFRGIIHHWEKLNIGTGTPIQEKINLVYFSNWHTHLLLHHWTFMLLHPFTSMHGDYLYDTEITLKNIAIKFCCCCCCSGSCLLWILQLYRCNGYGWCENCIVMDLCIYMHLPASTSIYMLASDEKLKHLQTERN